MAGSIEVARAYVTLVPSLKGAQQEITKELVPATEKAGKEAGEKAGKNIGQKIKEGLKSAGKGIASALGDAIKTGAKVVAAGVAATVTTAVAGITSITKAAISSFADYEQLVGGVEKIFDELDTSAIIADANAAYKNLNMSANEYLETINSVGAAFSSTMGDKKGYETAKRGMQAIADFASGTGRSVDELNEKYKSITRSTGSYQSIADQFSGILPATSAAFLEQAQAAGYLSDKYKSLTEVPLSEYQAAVTGMLEKGVDQLGLTGNTAKEALNTISGSIASTKGAWSNFVTSLASGEDITERLNDLQEAIFGVEGASNGLLNNIVPVVKKVIKNLGVAVRKILPILGNLMPDILAMVTEIVLQIVDILPEMVQLIADTIVPLLPTILTTIVQTFTRLLPILLQALPGIISTVLSMLTQIAQTVINALPQIIQTVLAILPQILPEIISALVNLVVLVLNNITSIIQPIIMALPDIIMSVVNALIDNLPILIDGIINLITGLISMLPTILPVLIEAGIEIFMMIVENIDQIINPLIDAIPEILGTIFDVIIDLIPTLFELIIKNLPKIIAGIVKVNLAIIKKIPQLLKSIWNAITKFFSDVWNSWIKPAAEKVGSFFSEIWKGIKKVALTAARFLMMNVAQPIALAFATAWDSIKYAAEVVWWALKKGFSAVINAIIDVINGMIDGINWALGWTGVNIENLGKVTVESFDEIGKKSNESADAVKKSFEGMDQWFEKELADPIEESFESATKNSKKSIGEILKGPKELKSTWETTMSEIKKLTGGKMATPTIDKPHLSITPKGWKLSDILTKGTLPKINIEWYAKAMNKGMLLDGPTIFGSLGDKLLGGGEAGQEVVVGSKSLMGMIQGAVSRGITTPNYSVNKNYTGNNINIIVNGAEGQDVEQLADIVLEKLQAVVTQKEVVYA